MKTVTLQEAQQDLDVLITHDTLPAEELDQLFDEGEDITPHLDLSTLQRPAYQQKQVNVSFPEWMIHLPDLGDDGVAFAQDIQSARKQLTMTKESWDES
jgi:hypothetical protein